MPLLGHKKAHDLVVFSGITAKYVAQWPPRRPEQSLLQYSFEWGRRRDHPTLPGGVDLPRKIGSLGGYDEKLQPALDSPANRGVNVFIAKSVANDHEPRVRRAKAIFKYLRIPLQDRSLANLADFGSAHDQQGPSVGVGPVRGSVQFVKRLEAGTGLEIPLWPRRPSRASP